MTQDLVLTTGAEPLPEGEGWATGAFTLDAHAPGARWASVAADLLANAAAWQSFDHVLVLDDGVHMSGAAIAELFRVMRQNALQVAQPSLAWSNHFSDPTALHNPSFVLRHTNRLDPAALAFSNAALRRWLPRMLALPGDLALGRLLTMCDESPLRASAVVDAAQAQRTLPPGAHETAPIAWPATLAGAGPQHEAATQWGGVGLRGRPVSLFDDTREEFLGLLATGYACAVAEPEPIGAVFLAHFARSLDPAPQALHLDGGTAAPVPRLRRTPIIDHARAAGERA